MRYVVISDIHANYTALEAVERVVHRLKQDGRPTQYRFLGDLVGYGPRADALACIRWLHFDSRIGDRWIPGNHDEWIVRQHDPAFSDRAKVTLTAQRAFLQRPENQYDWAWFQSQVTQALGYEQAEERSLFMENHAAAGNGRVAISYVHASAMPATRRTSYLYPWKRATLQSDLAWLRHQDFVPADAPTVCLLCGHSHMPVFARVDQEGFHLMSIKYGKPLPLEGGEVLINPGSVGQPRDGDPRASFAIIDSEAATVEFRRVPYDIPAVVGKLRADKNEIGHHEVYEQLIHILQDGHMRGGRYFLQYREVYRPPDWDLKAVND
jgi:diadenosine tetraphosphatase ApaH/serine/threonine PP2A family protein phosphatase